MPCSVVTKNGIGLTRNNKRGVHLSQSIHIWVVLLAELDRVFGSACATPQVEVLQTFG
jgi:hypothetical protein